MWTEARRNERILALAGLSALVVALACLPLGAKSVLTGWLGAAVLFQALPFGALLLLATMRLVRGAWQVELRPVCEAATLLLPFAALAFLPVLIGVGTIYDWDAARQPSVFFQSWMRAAPFVIRTLLWFGALFLIAGSQVGRRPSEGASACALIVLVIGGSLVAVDWLMSLDPDFHSSGFGLQLIALEIAAAYMAMLIVRLAAGSPSKRPAVLGGLLLMFLLFWIYFQFLTYFIIRSGNLPDGVGWYLARSEGGWAIAVWAASIFGLAPMLALLLPGPRGSRRWLIALGGIAFIGKCVEFAWFALPGRGWPAILSYILVLTGFGCVSAAALLTGLRGYRMREPRGGEP